MGIFAVRLLAGTFLIAWGLTSAADAEFTPYGFSGSSGVFAFSASGPADGGLPNPIVDNSGFFKTGSVLTADPLSGSSVTSFTSGNVMASGSAMANLGVLKASADMTTDLQSSVLFPAGFADTGWIDTLLVLSQNPADNGKVALVSVVLNVSGTLTADGPNVFSRFQMVVSSELGGPNLYNPSYQVQAGVNPSPTTISDTLVLDLPFVIGTPSQFLVRAMAQSMTSSATSHGNNASSASFRNTVTWGGIQGIRLSSDGTPIPEFTAVGTVSHIDWTQSVNDSAVPEPSTLALTLAAAPMLYALRRKRQRQPAAAVR